MRNNKTIVSEYKKKINILKKHNKYYYDDDNPKISDSEYDKLKFDLLEIEKKYPYLKKISELSKLVGSPPSNKFKKIKHLKPMLSLSNVFDKESMEDFIKKVSNYLNLGSSKNDIEFFSEPKIDGISATLIYKKGDLVNGLSRGDGITGEDILENLKTISIPKKIHAKDLPDLLEVRCEIYISKKDFNKLKKICKSKKCWWIIKTKRLKSD